jgi:glycosyltransferase involved in cell wall biosynthesis
MRIAVDARALTAVKPAGKENFTINLLEELFKLDKENHYILYLNKNFERPLPKNFSKRIIKVPNIFWHFFVLIDLIFKKPDLFFAPISYIIPALNFFSKNIIIVYDLVVFLPIKIKSTLKTKLIERFFLKFALNRAIKIITISENSKQDLIKIFKIESKKISVVYPAVSSNFFSIENNFKEILKKYNLKKDFILFVGTLEPRKNIVRLIEAYYNLISNFKIPIPNLKLVIVGKRGWCWQEIFDKVKKLNLEKKVIFLDYVPSKDLPYLYRKALCFVYPSLYEGFGLPVLEAMACGCPVITSNISSLSEVAEAAILIDPYDTNEITNALKKVLTDLNFSQELKEKGFKLVQKFSWQKSAQKILEIFHKIN